MGRIKNKTVKRAARELIEKYYNKLTDDFDLNKLIVDQVTDVSTKRVRNKIAGFTTHLMKRISKGPVRGISLKIQEEQRERLFDVAPEVSNINIENEYEADEGVLQMLKDQGFSSLIDKNRVESKSGFMKE